MNQVVGGSVPPGAPDLMQTKHTLGSGLGLTPISYFATTTSAGRNKRSLSQYPFCTTSNTTLDFAAGSSLVVTAVCFSGSNISPKGLIGVIPNFCKISNKDFKVSSIPI